MIEQHHYHHKKVIFSANGPSNDVHYATKKGHFWDISGSGRPNSQWFRITLRHNTLDTYTMIGQYHYPHTKVTFSANGPSNGFH